VDEFQNFATDSFATILSEARKYGLNLTVANQYISQMNDTVRDAVFGNVGTMVSFRVSADDAPILGKQFEPQFEPNDLLQMHNRHFIINMVIRGEKAPAFSATTLALPTPQTDNTIQIIENSRQKYSRTRAEVQAEIEALIASSQPQMPVPQSASMGKKWPVDSGAKRPQAPKQNQPQIQPAPQPQQKLQPKPEEKKIDIPQPVAEIPAVAGQGTSPSQEEGQQAPAKKRRSRSRRRKTGESGNEPSSNAPARERASREPAEQVSTPKPAPKREDELRSGTELRLR
jgi:hypothetical protein